MAGFTLYHNPRCSKSRQAVEAVESAGASADAEIVRYLEHPPTRRELEAIVARLEDPPAKLVRRERWDELGVVAADIATAAGVVDVLAAHPQLMERPLIVAGDRAFIGRPTERVVAFLAER